MTVWRRPLGAMVVGGVPIGVPMHGAQVYLRTAHGALRYILPHVPPAAASNAQSNAPLHVPSNAPSNVPSLSALGEPGELHFGGPFLATGYLSNEAETNKKFFDDTELGTRLYATGDVARWRDDGNLEFLGRADFQVTKKSTQCFIEFSIRYSFEWSTEWSIECSIERSIDLQVKVRGFRIELGEVEAVLRHAGAGAAVTIVVGDGAQQRLVAYASPATLEPAALRAACTSSLPSYAVPTQYVMLSALPRNTNGKIDRRALPPPPEPSAMADGADDTVIVEPRTPSEAACRRVWAEVLGVAEGGLSVEADWPLVGGNSLLAGRATSMLRKQLRCALPGTAMYTHSTITRLAALADSLGAVPQTEQVDS